MRNRFLSSIRADLRQWSVVAAMLAAACLTLSTPVIAQDSSSSALKSQSVVLQRCMIQVQEEIKVPAREPGVLLELNVREGAEIAQGDLVGKIDDRHRIIQRDMAEAEQKSAAAQAESDINVRYANAAADVAEAEYLAAIEANKRVAGTFPITEIRQLKLAWHKAFLQINQSELEKQVSGFTATAKGGEVKLSNTNIEDRRLLSPTAGQVVERYKLPGEWVQQGDPVVRIMRLDRLRVEGFVKASEYDLNDLADRPVKITVLLARGRTVEASGKIIFINPVIETGDSYRVWAEVVNRQEDNHWLLRPGQSATMTIDLQTLSDLQTAK